MSATARCAQARLDLGQHEPGQVGAVERDHGQDGFDVGIGVRADQVGLEEKLDRQPLVEAVELP